MKNEIDQLAYEKYASRINKVVDYIDANFSENFTLDELASIADFSKFHFCRLFQSFTGESLFSFISRIRLEKSADKLLRNLKTPITEIALDSGYSSSAVFAKAFRDKFDMTPTAWRESYLAGTLCQSNAGKTESNPEQAKGNWEKVASIEFTYIGYGKDANTWRFKMNDKETEVKVADWPETTVAYIRYVGPYAGNEELFKGLWDRLCNWAGPRGLLGKPESKFLIVYHDSPDITEEDKLRTSVCVTVPPNTEVSGEVGKLIIDPGKYAMGRFYVRGDEFGQAWAWMCGKWLPSSGYQADDRVCFEMYPESDLDENGKMVVDICIPVKPL